jgi:hypothetical protein
MLGFWSLRISDCDHEVSAAPFEVGHSRGAVSQGNADGAETGTPPPHCFTSHTLLGQIAIVCADFDKFRHPASHLNTDARRTRWKLNNHLLVRLAAAVFEGAGFEPT